MITYYDGEAFGDYFRRLRRSKGFKSQKKLAELSNVSQATISRIEDGTQKPLPETLLLLADALDISSIELLFRSGYLNGEFDDKKLQRIFYFTALQKDGIRDIKNSLTIDGVNFSVPIKRELEKILSENKPSGVNADNLLSESKKFIDGISLPRDTEELGDYLSNNKALFDTINQVIKLSRSYNTTLLDQMSFDIKTGEIEEGSESETSMFDTQQRVSEVLYKINRLFHQFRESGEGDSRDQLYFEKNLEIILTEFSHSILEETPIDLVEILRLESTCYAGWNLSPEDRQRILGMLKLLFPDRQDT